MLRGTIKGAMSRRPWYTSTVPIACGKSFLYFSVEHVLFYGLNGWGFNVSVSIVFLGRGWREEAPAKILQVLMKSHPNHRTGPNGG